MLLLQKPIYFRAIMNTKHFFLHCSVTFQKEPRLNAKEF